VLTLSLGDYKIPNIKDATELVTSLVEAGEGPGPFGVKAVAEAGISIVAPAIANAVYNATGVRIMESPLTSEKILRGLTCRAKASEVVSRKVSGFRFQVSGLEPLL
jgi:CO/xanthine dehydrogenase Mo-binding subunit